MKYFSVARRAWLPTLAWLLTACGGGGGGDDGGDNVVPDTPAQVSYGIGAPQSSLAQQPLAIDLAPAAGGARVSLLRRIAAAQTTEAFVFPSGPDTAGDALPKLSGNFSTQTAAYDQALNSKLWIDLPASAGGYRVAVTVTKVLRSASSLASGALIAGEMVITPREPHTNFSGRIRLAFNTTATPACMAWDAQANGSYTSEHCTTVTELMSLWHSPQPALAIPVSVQSTAAAAYAGWTKFHSQFEFSVGALLIAESNYDALQAAAAGAEAVTVPCSIYPPTGTAGSYALSWLDRNGSGRFDTGDDIRFVANHCWNRLDEEPGSSAGRTLDGTFVLRGYERNSGAAPTFVNMRLTDTLETGGIVTPQNTTEITGGFSVHAPGITASSGTVGAYRFTSDNMVAAGTIAAKAMDFYPDVGNLAYKALDAARQNLASPRDIGLCHNTGTSTLVFAEGAAPNASGLSTGDTVTLSLTHCDIGTPGSPKIMDGTLKLALWGVTLGPAPDWSMLTTARLDLQTTTTHGSTRRLGEFGLSMAYVFGHSYLVGFQPQSFSGTESLSGVLTAMENGALAYQIGCFSADYYTGTWALSDYQVMPNHVVKAANKVFTMGMRQGERFLFKADSSGAYYPDVALASMLSISAPECVALGVPATGVTGGDTNMQFDTWPTGDGGAVNLRLYDQSGTELRAVVTDWAKLTL